MPARKVQEHGQVDVVISSQHLYFTIESCWLPRERWQIIPSQTVCCLVLIIAPYRIAKLGPGEIATHHQGQAERGGWGHRDDPGHPPSGVSSWHAINDIVGQ